VDIDFSPGAMYASLIVSTIGTGFFIYGKKQKRFPHLAGGLLMMGVPYMFTNAWAVSAFGVAAVGIVVMAARMGY
jgi:hypothetical protein